MKVVIWLFLLAAIAGVAYCLIKWRRRRAELKHASEERFATFMAEAMTTAKPKASPQTDPAVVAKQRLLLDAAAKAAEAEEPMLAIELYARLLARYPDSAFAAQARAAVEAQKRKLAKT
jgi:uncharacterized protein YqhQ